jgi:hypothetical protein
MATGLEVGAAVFGLIAGAIDITHKAVEIYQAVEDKSGIPRSLKKVSEKLPSVERLLKDAEAQWKVSGLDKIDEQTTREFEHCKELCQDLHDLLLSIYPKASSGKGGRLLSGTKTVFSNKGKAAEGLLKEIRECLDTLTSRQIVSNAAALEELKSIGKKLLKGEGYTQQQRCAFVSNGHEPHGSVLAKSVDILQSWFLNSHGPTSSLVSSSMEVPPFCSSKSYAKLFACNRFESPHQVTAHSYKDNRL